MTHLSTGSSSRSEVERGRVSCVCGLVAREGSDLLSLDMCGGELGETLPQLSLSSLAASALRTRVLEARGGKILMVRMYESR
jgi:hypothetical protein